MWINIVYGTTHLESYFESLSLFLLTCVPFVPPPLRSTIFLLSSMEDHSTAVSDRSPIRKTLRNNPESLWCRPTLTPAASQQPPSRQSPSCLDYVQSGLTVASVTGYREVRRDAGTMDRNKSSLNPRNLIICVTTCTIAAVWAVIFAAIYFYFVSTDWKKSNCQSKLWLTPLLPPPPTQPRGLWTETFCLVGGS